MLNLNVTNVKLQNLGWQEGELDPRDLVPTQKGLTYKTLGELADNAVIHTVPLPRVVLQRNQFFILDGHHRVMIALIKGETLRCMMAEV